ITAEVPKIYVHQFWNTIKNIGKTEEEDLLTLIKELGYSGKCISGKSSGLDRLRELRAQILWVMYNQMNVDYVALLWEDFMYRANNREISSVRKENMPYPRFTKVIIDHFISKDNTISIRNKINLHTSRDDTLLVPLKKARKFKKHASSKIKTVTTSPKEPTQKGKRVKRAAKKATTTPTTSFVIRYTSNKSVSKKKVLAKSTSGSSEGDDFESKFLDEPTGKTKDTNEGTGVKPMILNVSKDDSSDSNNDSWGDSEAESDDDHDEDDNDDKDDNDDDDGNDDDSDSTIKQILKEQVKAQVSKIMPQIEKHVTKSLGAEVLVRSTNQPQTSYAVATSLSEFELKKILIDKMKTNKSINRSDIQKNLYIALIEAYNSDKDIFTSYGDVATLKRGRDDQDKDEDHLAGSDRWTKRRKSNKDAKLLKGSKSNESKSSNTEMHQDQGNESSHIDDQPDNEATPQHDWFQKPNKPPLLIVHGINQNQLTLDRLKNGSAPLLNNVTKKNNLLARPGFNLLKGTCKIFAKLKFHFKECYKAVNDRLDWHNLEGHEYLFDLSKLLPLIEDQGRQVVPADYFINNDLEYLKVQKKLSNLNVDDRYNLGVALRMFTRSIIILHRVEDLQLGVESYQKKLNITRTKTTRSNIFK
nr:hypothetical protein [Tanacetum cinerariifolium]